METEITKPDFLSIFSRLRGSLTNEELGVVAMTGSVWSEYELGKLLRIAMDVLESHPAGEMTEVVKAFAIGEDFYEEFNKYARRKLDRLASKYGIASSVLRLAIKANDNFEIVKGSESSTEYVRLAEPFR